MIVFDLDGCLIDSGGLIREAYREAGAEPPGDFLSLGHHDWIKGDREAVHARKDAAYLRRLAYGYRPLAPWDTARMLRRDGYTVSLLTTAPEGTVNVVAWQALTWPFSHALSVPDAAAKEDRLSAWGSGVYVDDQRYVTVPPGWRFVHYTGQNAGELYAEVTG